MKRARPELNTGSMADISFLLLTFFLLTSSIDTDLGILRRLPPPPDPTQEQVDIKKRNIFTVL
nr:biopolymer transporter ExbD [Bacteroidales bacterium]